MKERLAGAEAGKRGFCTIAGNHSDSQGGGYYSTGQNVRILHCTITGNTAATQGGGLWMPLLIIGNSIVAGNSAPTGPDVRSQTNVNFPLVSLGGNLIGKTDGSLGWINSDLTGTNADSLDPLLGPLQNNGGPTSTHALLPGSPAIDAGGLDEVQRVRVPSAASPFQINFLGQTTGPLERTDSAATVQAALESLSTIGAGNVLVTRSGNTVAEFFIHFRGVFAGIDQAQLTATGPGATHPTVTTLQQSGSAPDSDQRGPGFPRIVKGNTTSPAARIDIGAYELFAAPTFAAANVNIPTNGGAVALATLSGATPTGGTFSGAGVDSATGTFAPTGFAPGDVETITYTISDDFGVQNLATFTVTIVAAPAFTSADAATFTIGADGTFTIAASGFPAPAFSLTGTLPEGMIFDETTGTLSGTPAAGTHGSFTFTITATNGVGEPVSQTFTLSINRPPVPRDDTLGAVMDNPVQVSAAKLLANDRDPDGDPLALTAFSPASAQGGTVALANGILTYIPPAGFTGADQFTYTVSDGRGGATTAVRVTESFSFNVNQTIPDGSSVGIADTRLITTDIVAITSITVSIGISGGFNGDLYAYLTNGTDLVVLLNRSGRTLTNLLGYPDEGFNVTFDDAATNGDIHFYQLTLDPQFAPLTGTWQPSARDIDPELAFDTTLRTTFLNTFHGTDPNVQWTLFVADLETGGVAQFESWGMVIEGAIPEPSSLLLCLLYSALLLFRRIR